jgi:hypothetical protein
MGKLLSEAVDELGYPDADWLPMDGDVVERLAEQSADLDLLVVGSRGYGPFPLDTDRRRRDEYASGRPAMAGRWGGGCMVERPATVDPAPLTPREGQAGR